MKAQCSYFLKLSSRCFGHVTPLDMLLSFHQQVSSHEFTVNLLLSHKWNYVDAVDLVFKGIGLYFEQNAFCHHPNELICRYWVAMIRYFNYQWLLSSDPGGTDTCCYVSKMEVNGTSLPRCPPSKPTTQSNNSKMLLCTTWPAYSLSCEIMLCYYPILHDNTHIFNYFLEQTTERCETQIF